MSPVASNIRSDRTIVDANWEMSKSQSNYFAPNKNVRN